MAPHEERVVTERTELAEKLEKLDAFIGGETFRSLDEIERLLLLTQRDQMGAYLTTLQRRVARFV